MTLRGKSVITRRTLVAVLVVSWFAGTQPANGQKLYWADRDLGTIFRSELDGSAVEPVINVLPAVLLSLTIDVDAGKLYWSEAGTVEGSIRRSALDGSDAEIVHRTPKDITVSLAIDSLHEDLYWSERLARDIRRSDLDGKSVEDVLLGLAAAPGHINLDPVGGYLYWTDAGGELLRAGLDGSEPHILEAVMELVYDRHDRITGLSFEPIGRDLYVIASGEVQGTYGTHWFLYRGRPDGSEAVEISRAPGRIRSLQFDRPGGMMYWVEMQEFPRRLSIRRAALAGCGAQDVITEGLHEVFDLAIDTAVRPRVDFAVGVCPNDLSQARQLLTPVAILGGAALDVYKVDPQSIHLVRADGSRREIRPLVRGGSAVFMDVGWAGETKCECGSSQPDGVLDAVFSFSTAELRRLSQPGPGNADEPVELVLRGRLNDGRPVVGTGCIGLVAD